MNLPDNSQLMIMTNGSKTFTFTIKSLGSDLDSDYTTFLDKLTKYKIKVHYKQGERDDSGKFHFHGLIDIPKGFYRKKLVTQGNNLKLVEFYPGDAWETYTHKSVKAVNTIKPKMF